MIYDLIAPIYDEVNGDINYYEWAKFVQRIIEKFGSGIPCELMLDLGCGTGSMTIALAQLGYDMTGVDISTEMLDIARDRAADAGYEDKILWLCQDMREFELYGTVDAAVCSLDGINHLITNTDLDKCLRLVHNYLVPGGLFIFDVNGKYKFENVYADETYCMENEDSVCVWQNYYNEKSHLCDFYITLFKKVQDGRYERYDDTETERMYTLRSLKNALKRCSMEFVGAYSDFEFTNATDNDERIYIVARCIK